MDPLSAVIAVLSPHAAVSKPISGRGDWGVRYPAYGRPGFAIVLDGGCWLALEGRAPVRLERGDFVLLPATPAFEMSSRVGVACVASEPSPRPVRHGDPDGPPDFRMLGGGFEIERANAALMQSLLPEMIHIRAAESDTTGLSRVISLIMDETAAEERPGGEMILQRLMEVMLIEALRQGSPKPGIRAGLLGGMHDAAVAKALRAIHADVRARWTVASLARMAGMSRSAFAARFAGIVGCGPIEYLSNWRIALAKDSLARGGTPLDRLADEIGYESASAFSTAFRRHVGCPPGAFARACGPASENRPTG